MYKRLLAYEEDEIVGADYAGINFYEWIINPHSFSESVENLFYTSFLIREGKLVINIGEDGVPRMCEYRPRSVHRDQAFRADRLEYDLQLTLWVRIVIPFRIPRLRSKRFCNSTWTPGR